LRTVKGLLQAAPLSGLLLMAGALALAGFPPFNIFVSEFLIFAAGVQSGYAGLMILCALFFTVTVAGLVQVVAGSVLGKSPEAMAKGDVGWLSLAPMVVLIGLVLMLGFAVPRPMSRLIQTATDVVLDRNTPILAAELWPFEEQALGQAPVSAITADPPHHAAPEITPTILVSVPSHPETHP
jgi:hydrogenase-4 component F